VEPSQVRQENPDLGFLDIGRKLGEMWRALDPESKKVYEDRATAAKDQYLEQKTAWEAQQKAMTGGGAGVAAAGGVGGPGVNVSLAQAYAPVEL
jgi:hypothetical protein